jgi:hypothetical protein
VKKRFHNVMDKLNKNDRRYGTTGHAPGTWEAVLSLIPMPKASAELLNAGCGRFFPTIPGYELWHTDIRKNKLKKNYVQADLNEGIPFIRKSFKGVIAMELIEHLENPSHFLREATRVATDWVIITYPNNESTEARKAFRQTGNFPWFSEQHARKNGHITPLFSWQIHHIAEKLNWTTYNTLYNNPITKEITVQRLYPKSKL